MKILVIRLCCFAMILVLYALLCELVIQFASQSPWVDFALLGGVMAMGLVAAALVDKAIRPRGDG